MNLLQGRNREADVENGHGRVVNWEKGVDIRAVPCVKQTASWNLPYTAGSSGQ